MARRKKKVSQEESAIKLTMFVGFLIGLYLTQDIAESLFVALFFVVIVGVIILIIHSARKKRLRLSGIHDIDKMKGIEFEEYLKVHYQDRGYTVKITPTSGDFGADLVLQKNNHRIVVQVKRYSKTVGIKAVQEIIPAIKHYHAQEAWVVTNNYFTKAAQELAASNHVRLIGRDDLVSDILQKNQG